MKDHHVDRPGVEVGQPMKLTGSDRPSDSDPVARVRCPSSVAQKGGRDRPRTRHTIIKGTHTPEPSLTTDNRPLTTCMDRTTWWLWRGARTRSLPELGRENPQRPWYCASRHGRVGRRQVFQSIQRKRSRAANEALRRLKSPDLEDTFCQGKVGEDLSDHSAQRVFLLAPGWTGAARDRAIKPA